jgi:hypothetical protein
MPTRVLDVGDSVTSEVVRLVETAGQRERYIALSHSWGRSEPFITDQANIEGMKKGFSPKRASATFFDATKVVRQLRIRYLWIDSLCIIQRNKIDVRITKLPNAFYFSSPPVPFQELHGRKLSTWRLHDQCFSLFLQ